jgi:hypothetical protein
MDAQRERIAVIQALIDEEARAALGVENGRKNAG